MLETHYISVHIKRFLIVRSTIQCKYQAFGLPFQSHSLTLDRYFPLIKAFEATNGSMDDLVQDINGMKKTCKVYERPGLSILQISLTC